MHHAHFLSRKLYYYKGCLLDFQQNEAHSKQDAACSKHEAKLSNSQCQKWIWIQFEQAYIQRPDTPTVRFQSHLVIRSSRCTFSLSIPCWLFGFLLSLCVFPPLALSHLLSRLVLMHVKVLVVLDFSLCICMFRIFNMLINFNFLPFLNIFFCLWSPFKLHSELDLINL